MFELLLNLYNEYSSNRVSVIKNDQLVPTQGKSFQITSVIELSVRGIAACMESSVSLGTVHLSYPMNGVSLVTTEILRALIISFGVSFRMLNIHYL